jgi:hypothetical protein
MAHPSPILTVKDLLLYIRNNNVPFNTPVEVQDYENMEFKSNLSATYAFGGFTITFEGEYDDNDNIEGEK